MQIVNDELVIERNGKKFYLHHGDGLGPGDKKYKFLRKVFRNPVCQWLFGILPASIGMGIANGWSAHSRAASKTEEVFLGRRKSGWPYMLKSNWKSSILIILCLDIGIYL